MATKLAGAIAQIIFPTKVNPKGTATTPTFNPTNTANVLSAPAYRDHLTDIFATRSAEDSRSLIKSLFKQDPDMSASVNAFLTVADTELVCLVKTLDGQLDPAGQKVLTSMLVALTTRSDYSKGFKAVPTLSSLAEAFRMMLLMRGGCGAELVMSKELFPSEVRHVDVGTLEWFEKAPGQFTPQQRSVNGDIISLDIPSFFVTWFRRDPTEIYTTSPFVSAINTIAARQQVINDLYRIMQVTGYPRMDIKVLEEVIVKNAPVNAKLSEEARAAYVRARLQEISTSISSLKSNQSFIHTDAVEATMMNEKSPGMAIDITPVIQTLNAQNQAGLKTMATILGRGESGVNTASVEARIFSLSAQALNEPVAAIFSQILTMGLRFHGVESYVECYYQPVEMRSQTELETQLLVRSQRLKDDLSLGLISDVEYHLWMYNRLPPENTPELSGTLFADPPDPVDATNEGGRGDSVTKAASTKEGNKGSRDNKSKPKSKARLVLDI